METFNLMTARANQFDTLKSELDRGIVMGRLESLKDLALYIDSMRESYTRLLVVNNVTEEQYENEVESGEACPPEKKENINMKIIDTDEDLPSFDNC